MHGTNFISSNDTDEECVLNSKSEDIFMIKQMKLSKKLLNHFIDIIFGKKHQ